MTYINTHYDSVIEDWIDYNGHMNVAYYVLVFDRATDATLEKFEIGETYRKKENKSVFVVESHVTYDHEVHKGARLLIKTRLLGVDRKRIHLFHEMYGDDSDVLCATNEIMAVHVDLGLRKTAEMTTRSVEILSQARGASLSQGWPEKAGRQIKKLIG